MRTTNAYVRTFDNTPEGIQSYKDWVKDFRKVVTGGRITKHFRGGSNYRYPSSKTGVRFDVYVHRRWDSNTNKSSFPKIGHLTIKSF